jgi:hypothetical protein
MMRPALALLAALAPAVARADDAPVPAPADLAADIDDLYERQHALERAQRKDDATREQVKSLLPVLRFITAFVDVGAFAVAGDGSGIRSDIGHIYFPKYAGRVGGEWVFMGDPLSTAVNARGEPSDTANSRSIDRDTINSHGRPSVLVNSLGIGLTKAVRRDVVLRALAELLPRPGQDRVSVEIAAVDLRPYDDRNVTISIGKVDSVLGVEYRDQDPNRRLSVTPSLINRYLSGRPLGVRAQYETDHANLSAALTNGDSFQTQFEAKDELKSNRLPTLSLHAQVRLHGIGDGLEAGVSFALGPQDRQTSVDVLQWHTGVDARLHAGPWTATAEYVQGAKQGQTEMLPCDVTECLRYKGAYLLADRRIGRLRPYIRLDWRSAVHTSGTAFVYESHVWRSTLGVQWAVTSKILAKAEYVINRELDGIPQFPDDILTTSLVVATD